MPIVTNEKNETLYHIQSGSLWTDDPIDIFVFASAVPSNSEIRKLVIEDLELDVSNEHDLRQLNEIATNATAYTVYTY